jgi:hypothetical protein
MDNLSAAFRYTAPSMSVDGQNRPPERERGRKSPDDDSRIEPFARDAERGTEVVHRDAPVTLE